jgi:hypothetical protein
LEKKIGLRLSGTKKSATNIGQKNYGLRDLYEYIKCGDREIGSKHGSFLAKEVWR